MAEWFIDRCNITHKGGLRPNFRLGKPSNLCIYEWTPGFFQEIRYLICSLRNILRLPTRKKPLQIEIHFPAHECNVDGSIDSEGSERGILAEPAAHLSADEDRGATQVQQPHRDEGGASRYVRIDDSAEGHPPTRHRRAQDRAYRDLCPRVVAADHLRADGRLRHERVQLGMRTKVWLRGSVKTVAAAHPQDADRHGGREQERAGHSGSEVERPSYGRKGADERVRRGHPRVGEWRPSGPTLVDQLLERPGGKRR